MITDFKLPTAVNDAHNGSRLYASARDGGRSPSKELAVLLGFFLLLLEVFLSVVCCCSVLWPQEYV